MCTVQACFHGTYKPHKESERASQTLIINLNNPQSFYYPFWVLTSDLRNKTNSHYRMLQTTNHIRDCSKPKSSGNTYWVNKALDHKLLHGVWHQTTSLLYLIKLQEFNKLEFANPFYVLKYTVDWRYHQFVQLQMMLYYASCFTKCCIVRNCIQVFN